MRTIQTISQAKKRRNKISKIAWSIFGFLFILILVSDFISHENLKFIKWLFWIFLGYIIVASISVYILFNDAIRAWGHITDIDGMGARYDIKAAYLKLKRVDKTELELSLNESLTLKNEWKVILFRGITSLQEMDMQISKEDTVLVTLQKKLKKLETI